MFDLIGYAIHQLRTVVSNSVCLQNSVTFGIFSIAWLRYALNSLLVQVVSGLQPPRSYASSFKKPRMSPFLNTSRTMLDEAGRVCNEVGIFGFYAVASAMVLRMSELSVWKLKKTTGLAKVFAYSVSSKI